MVEPFSIEGRSREIAVLVGFLDGVGERSSALIVEGEPGIGKTVLWESVVAQAAERGWVTLGCRPGEFETDLVFAALGDLVDPIMSLIDELPVTDRRVLRAALLLDEPASPGVDQRAVGKALLGLLRRLGRDSPVLVAVDDLQWIDAASVKVLQFAVRRLGVEPVGLLGALRPAVAEGPAMRWPGAQTLPIGPLDRSSIEALLRDRLSTPLRGSRVRRICEVSGGNPFFALELARADARDHLDVGFPMALPPSLEGVLDQRLSRLSQRTRDALVLVAVLPDQPTATIRRALADANHEMSTLDPAFDSGVLTRVRDRIAFTHPLLASNTYWRASTTVRSNAHRVVGALLHGTAAGLRHRAMVTDEADAGLAAALEHTAAGVATRGAPDAAATLLSDAVRLTPGTDVTGRVRRVVACADRHLDAGETGDAIAVLRDVQRGLPAGRHRAQVLHTLARAVGQVGGFRAGSALLLEALDEAGDDLKVRGAIERDLANAMSNYGDLRGALVHGEQARQHAIASGDADLLHGADVGVAVSRLFVGLGPPADIDAKADDALARLEAGQHVQAGAQLLDAMTWAAMLKWIDRFDTARPILRRLAELLDDRHEDGLTLPVLFQLGELECWSGRLATASQLATACAGAASATGQQAWIPIGLYLRARVDADRGSIEAARAAAVEGLHMATQHDDARMMIRHLHVLGLVELDRDPAGASPHLAQAVELADECGYGEPGVFRIAADAIEALVAAGHLDEADHQTAILGSTGRRLGRPYALVTSTRCRALLSFARGDLDDAVHHAAEAVRAHETLPQPIELGRTLLLHGTIQRRRHHKADARSALSAALSLFVEHGAAGWANRTRRELARIGGRSPTSQTLTPSEHAVAALVARGRRNQEIASELHISTKTVEANLTRIYRKLGIRSRVDLAARRLDQT